MRGLWYERTRQAHVESMIARTEEKARREHRVRHQAAPAGEYTYWELSQMKDRILQQMYRARMGFPAPADLPREELLMAIATQHPIDPPPEDHRVHHGVFRPVPNDASFDLLTANVKQRRKHARGVGAERF